MTQIQILSGLVFMLCVLVLVLLYKINKLQKLNGFLAFLLTSTRDYENDCEEETE